MDYLQVCPQTKTHLHQRGASIPTCTRRQEHWLLKARTLKIGFLSKVTNLDLIHLLCCLHEPGLCSEFFTSQCMSGLNSSTWSITFWSWGFFGHLVSLLVALLCVQTSLQVSLFGPWTSRWGPGFGLYSSAPNISPPWRPFLVSCASSRATSLAHKKPVCVVVPTRQPSSLEGLLKRVLLFVCQINVASLVHWFLFSPP